MKYRETSAGGVVFRNGTVLILQTPSDEWVLPKGKIEDGESGADTAMREVLEETGIQTEAVEPLGVTQYRYRKPSGVTINKVVHWLLMEYRSGQIQVESIFQDGRFVTPNEALRLLSHGNDREIVEQAIEQMSSRARQR
jgi:8-oxo-dGTP pyrophosphatase MutT (NUDIX family)